MLMPQERADGRERRVYMVENCLRGLFQGDKEVADVVAVVAVRRRTFRKKLLEFQAEIFEPSAGFHRDILCRCSCHWPKTRTAIGYIQEFIKPTCIVCTIKTTVELL
jgi:hypothetical protein